MMERVFPLARAVRCSGDRGDHGRRWSARNSSRPPAASLKSWSSAPGDFGIPPEDILVDCLALTVGADSKAGRITLDTMQLVQSELGVNLSLGASNVSFGLPDRKWINIAYLALAVAKGLTAAITDPTVMEIRTTLLACDLLMGRDEYSMSWIKAYRKRERSSGSAGLKPGADPDKKMALRVALYPLLDLK